jgi:UDP-glucose 4-epimerase
VLEVLGAVERVAGVTLKRNMAERRAGDPPALVADNRRILETFSWQPRYGNLDTIVTHALAWERKLAERTSAEAT